MLIPRGDGTFSAGMADMICILKLPAGTYHVAFFEEHPLPGPVKPISELSAIRFKSKMHHTTGAPSLAEAQKQLEEMRKKIQISDANVVSDVAMEVEDPVMNLVLPNWTLGTVTLKEALGL